MQKPQRFLIICLSNLQPAYQFIKCLPISINKRLNKNSSSKEIFNQTKSEYDTDLKKSGYHNGELKLHKEEEIIKNKQEVVK